MKWLALLVLLPGCCWLSKRSCFPACPPPDKVVVELERPCELPPIELEAISRDTCPEGYRGICFTIPEAGKLAKNIDELKDWVSEARKRCAIAPGPATQPTTRPARPDS